MANQTKQNAVIKGHRKRETEEKKGRKKTYQKIKERGKPQKSQTIQEKQPQKEHPRQ